jgi:SHS2 domain-containing protein
MSKKEIEILDHTGDVGIKVFGTSLTNIFVQAAHGMFAIICPDDKIGNQIERRVEVDGQNLEEVFVNWLSELNYHFSVEHTLFSEFQIEKLEQNRLNATIRGEKMNPNIHHIHTEIKAVTFHKLYVRKIGHNWEAQVIFDI